MPVPLKIAVSLLLLLVLAASPSQASETADIYYGRGVQAYLDGEWARAEAYFDRAVTYAPQNARAYYFRGLSRQKQDQPYRADADLRQGAVLEANAGGGFRLGIALSRVAKADRERLDQVRSETLGHLPSFGGSPSLPGGAERQAQNLRAKFRLSLDVLESVDTPERLAQLVEATRPTTIMRASPTQPTTPNPEMVASDPFKDDPIIPAEARGSMSLGDLTNVFGGALGSFLPKPPAQLEGMIPSGGAQPGMNPFGDGGGAMPGGDMPGAGDDPFGGGGDPFGDAPPAGEDPFATDDPFAEPDSSPASEAEPEEPAEEPAGEDPFGEDPFADEDPFG